MTTSNRDWMSRMQKRNELAMTMLRRPSEIDVDARARSSSNEEKRSASPTSRSSSHSAESNSLNSIEEAHVLETQYKKNEALIKANEERMQRLQDADGRMATDIQQRMSAVMLLNQQLSHMRDMLARAEKVSRGEFGAPVKEL